MYVKMHEYIYPLNNSDLQKTEYTLEMYRNKIMRVVSNKNFPRKGILSNLFTEEIVKMTDDDVVLACKAYNISPCRHSLLQLAIMNFRILEG